MKNISSKEPDIIEYIPGKYAEEKLWQKESLYRSLFNEMLSAFILFEIIYDNEGKPRDYRFLDVNPAFEKMTGLCISQVQEKNFIEVFSDVDPSWYENFYRVVSTEKPVHFEGYSHKLKKYADVIAYMPQKGQLAIMLTDITERKTMEVALRQSEEKYRILSEASQDIIYVINKDDYVEYVNSFAAKQFKCSPEELIGKPRSSLFPPELASQQKYFLEKVFKTGQVVQSESKQQFLEHVCWQNTRLVPLKDETGEVRAVMGVSRDITETKRVDEALRVSEERLKFALEGTNDGVWDWNILTGEAYFSPRYYTMLGYEPYEFQPSYESWKSLVHPDDIEIMEHVDFKKDNYTLEFRMREKTGEWYWIKSRGKVVEWDEYGKPIRMVGTHTDITDQKEAENKLRLSEEKFFKETETVSSPES